MANEILFVCPSDIHSVSDQMILNWKKSPLSWYSSWGEITINHHRFIGGIRSKLNKLPANKNPELSFYNAVIRPGHYDGEYGVFCVYQIQNNEVEDVGDKLYLNHFVTAQMCRHISSSDILCRT